ncbi:related to transcription factor SKN7 [Rhynchosporium graminicola]|uniref:Transcription factor n=1 Tax=Rhynchosporium graminicola TaxID=2792576 RepID=A0A1E1K3B8_9HELO|nr:related to transcription factor SKN7 [Rhynchosporium commune]
MDKGEMGGPAANNSSDFVRKLYKMLEDPSYDSIVKWGDGGESFVVLENEKFTKQILPKHFKHSNFASFVRQLNKYDFHKVRQNNEDSTPSQYGAGAWEFKHPEFQANKKDSLDNIRRKAPAPRKSAQAPEEQYPPHQMDLVNSQLIATQQQLQQLSEMYQDLAQGHVTLLQQVVALQKIVKAHEGAMMGVMGFLHGVDANQRRASRIAGPFNNAGGAIGEGALGDDGPPASPLQKASALLDEFSTANMPDKHLEQMSHDFHLRTDFSTTPPDHGSTPLLPRAETTGHHVGYPGGNDLDNMVYPVGRTNGIDPINSEHINNIPYALPPSNALLPPNDGLLAPDVVPGPMSSGSSVSGSKKRTEESPWGINKPHILLVEDDKVCARIGSKFLQTYECGVEIARNGLEAVNKMNNAGNSYDLIFMDIIMPHLDGVSATACIREIKPNIPIIAMTSNIRADDIDMYFRYGMNDVLPKPFTKEGMYRALEKHLSHFKKSDSDQPFAMTGQPQMPQPVGFVTPNAAHAPLGLNMGQLSAPQSLKEEASPGKSPITASAWHSPNQLPGPSPIGSTPGGYMQPMGDNRQYTMTPTHQSMPPTHQNMTPTHPHPQSGFPPPGGQMATPRNGQPHRRGISDMSGGLPNDQADKRQRMFPPPGFPHQ